MSQAFLTGNKGTSLASKISNGKKFEDTEVLTEKINKDIRKGWNNHPLCVRAGICDDDFYDDDDNNENPNTELPPTIVYPDLRDTFETIYKNIKSYDNTVVMTHNKKYLTKTISLPENKEIVVETDLRTSGLIVSRITGDTGYDEALVRTTEFEGVEKLDVKYTLES